MDSPVKTFKGFSAKRPSRLQVFLYYVKKSKKTRVLGVLLIGILVGLALPIVLEKYVWNHRKLSRPDCQLPPAYRLDALARYGNTTGWHENTLKEKCDNETSCRDSKLDPSRPCYHPHPAHFFYKVVKITECNSNYDYEVEAKVEERNLPTRKSSKVSLQMKVREIEDHRLFIEIFNDVTDFDPRDHLDYARKKPNMTSRCNREGRKYDLSDKPQVGSRTFVNVKRRSKDRSLFNTNFGALIAEDKYLEITTVLPSHNVYGLGQGSHKTLRHNLTNSTTWTLFAGQDTSWGHGVHPFYLCLEDDGNAHGVLLEHSNAMEVTLQDVPSVTYRTTGSKLVFHILLGPTPHDVIKQLTALVGRPEIPPYWALGHHVCRRNESHSYEALEKLRKDKVPQESDCFADSLSLWNNESNWADFANFSQMLHERNQKTLLVHVPHVLDGADYEDRNLIRNGSETVVGNLQGNVVHYADYFSDGVTKWTANQLKNVFLVANLSDGFDGYLLTNNTPVDERERSRVCSDVMNFPDLFKEKMDLWNKTVCMDTCHGSCRHLFHFDLHNLYSYKHVQAVAKALNGMKEYESRRPLIASMSTFTGSGKFGGQFSVGFSTSWANMKISLVQTLEFNLYGVPLTGAPVCGYHFKKDRDLCSRWTQVAAFQPFLISYHGDESGDVLSPILMDGFVTSVAVSSFQLRYSLLPYLYTMFYYASTEGTPVVRPLFFEFPQDPVTAGIDEQFMWGPGLLVSPVLKNSTVEFPAYFPAGVWYDYYTGDTTTNSDRGVHKNLTANEYHVNLHVRGGQIVTAQKQGIFVDDVRNSSYKLRVAFHRPVASEGRTAVGQLYIDDGISRNGPKVLINMRAEEGKEGKLFLDPNILQGSVEDLNSLPISYFVDSIYVFGMRKSVSEYMCHINGKEVRCKREDEHSTLNFRDLGTEINLLEQNNVTWTDKLD